MLVDTHAHIHKKDYGLDPGATLRSAQTAGVEHIICVGTDVNDSQRAIDFAAKHKNCSATVGLHPHDANPPAGGGEASLKKLEELVRQPKVVAVGECGLDYFYQHSPKEAQSEALRFQIELGLKHGLPFVFHVRDAYEDFLAIVDEYQGLRGVVHSFSSTPKHLHEVLKRGFYVGLNGIMTFTKDAEQLAAAKEVPIDKLLLETDSPFLTPTPYRGKINKPENVMIVAEFLANLRGEPFEELAEVTTTNARTLFGL